MKKYLFILMIGMVNADEADLGFLRIHNWDKIVEGQEVKLEVVDRWFGGGLGGVLYEGKQFEISKEIKETLVGISKKNGAFTYKQEAPWSDKKKMIFVVLNKKGGPIYTLTFPEKNDGDVLIKQIIKVPKSKNKARFAHGDEDLVYLEVKSPSLTKKLQELIK